MGRAGYGFPAGGGEGAQVLRRRPPTTLERLLGRERVRRLRRQLAHAAFGTGFLLYRPTLRRTASAFGAGVAITTIFWWFALA
jgi:hypothetical protein